MADTTEGNGFTVTDKRSVGKEDAPKQEKAEAEQAAEQAARSAEKSMSDCDETPLPEMNFATLIFSLSTSVLVHLGDMADPQTGQMDTQLPLAKQTIDLLGMLQEKTKGNLEEDEEKLMEGVLYDLRMKFVEACKKKK